MRCLVDGIVARTTLCASLLRLLICSSVSPGLAGPSGMENACMVSLICAFPIDRRRIDKHLLCTATNRRSVHHRI